MGFGFWVGDGWRRTWDSDIAWNRVECIQYYSIIYTMDD